MARLLPIALLVSGGGSTLEGIAELVAGGHIPARIVLVVADRPHIPAIEKARRRGLPSIVIPSHGIDPLAWSRRLTTELDAKGVELVVLAGFLTILPPEWVEHWRGRAVNLHPSLLPRHGGPGMYGPKVHEAVIRARDPESGATVHLVTNDIDRGPAIAQERIPVLPSDTAESLRSRLRPIEIALLAATIRRFADGSLPLPYPSPNATTPGRKEKPDFRQ